jgi:hypothetical protein
VFRGKFIHYLQQAFRAGQLLFPGKARALGTEKGFGNLIQQLWRKDWVVYAKRPFAGPEQVLDYLGRYTHRVAIANHRIQQVEDGWVTFTYRDRRNGGELKAMTLRAEEFIRRFLLHVVPDSYMRIRHFGFLANRNKEQDLGRCRDLLGVARPISDSRGDTGANTQELMRQLTGVDLTKCPGCQQGTMVVVDQIPRFSPPGPARKIAKPALLDSS